MKDKETIEEAAENKLRLEFENTIRNRTKSNIEFMFETSGSNYIKWLENKWQQERSYSEQEVLLIIEYIQLIIRKIDAENTPEEIVRLLLINRNKIEQFKKK